MEFSKLNDYYVKDKKAIRYYDTINDMLNDETLKVNMLVETKGYYDVNDKGNSKYYITDTQNQDEYQEELANGLYANLITNNYVMPEMFGCYGNGEDDDSDNMQLCFNYAEKFNLKVIATKTYLISKQLEFNGYIDGNNTGLFKTLSTSRFNGALIYSNDYLKVINLNFDCSCDIEFTEADKFTNYNNAINCTDTKTVFIENCTFHNLYNKFISIRNNKNENIKIINNNFYSDNKTNIFMSCMISIGSITNNNCEIFVNNNFFKGFSYTYVDEIDNDYNCNASAITSSNLNVENYCIENNTFEDLGKYGSKVNANGHSRLCVIDFYYNVKNAIIKNNSFKSSHWCCLRLHGCENTIVENNYFNISRQCDECCIIITDGYNSTGEVPVGNNNIKIIKNIFDSTEKVMQCLYITGYGRNNNNIAGIYGQNDNLIIDNNIFNGKYTSFIDFDCSLKKCYITNNIVNNNTHASQKFLFARQASYLTTNLPNCDYSNTYISLVNNDIETSGACVIIRGTDEAQNELFDKMTLEMILNKFKTLGNNYCIYGANTSNCGIAIKNVIKGYGGIATINKAYDNIVFYKSNSSAYYNITTSQNNTQYTY